MTNDEPNIGDLIQNLRAQAGDAFRTFGTNLTSFNDGYGCPWLEFWESIRAEPPMVNGVLILQDWGVASGNGTDSIEDAAEEIASDSGSGDDMTLANLRNSKWWDHIESGAWIVTNAVWALRTEGDKCGSLPAEIHKKAYGIWGRLLLALAQINPKLQVVFCGSWCGWKTDFPGRNSVELREVIEKWNKWVKDTDLVPDSFKEGMAYYYPHPSTWSVIPNEGPDRLPK